jgi:hypothetical protein
LASALHAVKTRISVPRGQKLNDSREGLAARVISTTKEHPSHFLKNGLGEDCNQQSDLTAVAEGVTGHIRKTSVALSPSRVVENCRPCSKMHTFSAASPRLFQRESTGGKIVCPQSKQQIHIYSIHNLQAEPRQGFLQTSVKSAAERMKNCSPAQFQSQPAMQPSHERRNSSTCR